MQIDYSDSAGGDTVLFSVYAAVLCETMQQPCMGEGKGELGRAKPLKH